MNTCDVAPPESLPIRSTVYGAVSADAAVAERARIQIELCCDGCGDVGRHRCRGGQLQLLRCDAGGSTGLVGGETHQVGTGVGGGIIVNGQLLRGAFGIAAEIGHLRVLPEGHLCGCGARGCFEQYASGNALLRHAREAIAASPDLARNLLSRGDGTLEGLTGRAITDAAREGDQVAISAFNTTAQWLGAGIASLSVILDPECVVIGGGVVDAGEILLAPTRAAMERYMPFAGKHPYPEIIAATLGNEAGLVGAADLARG